MTISCSLSASHLEPGIDFLWVVVGMGIVLLLILVPIVESSLRGRALCKVLWLLHMHHTTAETRREDLAGWVWFVSLGCGSWELLHSCSTRCL